MPYQCLRGVDTIHSAKAELIQSCLGGVHDNAAAAAPELGGKTLQLAPSGVSVVLGSDVCDDGRGKRLIATKVRLTFLEAAQSLRSSSFPHDFTAARRLPAVAAPYLHTFTGLPLSK